jgi:type II secretory pathway pseudopilin PulG
MKFSARAFSLTSTLVAITVIIVLLAILLPSLAAARRQAQRTRCAVNLRNLGHAVAQYRMDYNAIPLSYCGAEPIVRPLGPNKDVSISDDILYSNAAWRDHGWQGLPGLLETYLQKQSQCFICPATQSSNPIPLVWKGQPAPIAGASDDPEMTGSYDFYMGASFMNAGNNGKGNQTFYYPGTPPDPYPGVTFPALGMDIAPTLVLAMDRFYADNNSNGNGNGKGKSKNASSGPFYSNHTNGSASWQPDTFTATDYRVGIYRGLSTSSFAGIHQLRLDGSVSQVQPNDLTAIMIKAPGIGNGQIIYGPFPP